MLLVNSLPAKWTVNCTIRYKYILYSLFTHSKSGISIGWSCIMYNIYKSTPSLSIKTKNHSISFSHSTRCVINNFSTTILPCSRLRICERRLWRGKECKLLRVEAPTSAWIIFPSNFRCIYFINLVWNMIRWKINWSTAGTQLVLYA